MPEPSAHCLEGGAAQNDAARDRRICRVKRRGTTWRCLPSRAPSTGTLGARPPVRSVDDPGDALRVGIAGRKARWSFDEVDQVQGQCVTPSLWRARLAVIGRGCGPDGNAPPEDAVRSAIGTEQDDKRGGLGLGALQPDLVNRPALEDTGPGVWRRVVGLHPPLAHQRRPSLAQQALLVGLLRNTCQPLVVAGSREVTLVGCADLLLAKGPGRFTAARSDDAVSPFEAPARLPPAQPASFDLNLHSPVPSDGANQHVVELPARGTPDTPARHAIRRRHLHTSGTVVHPHRLPDPEQPRGLACRSPGPGGDRPTAPNTGSERCRERAQSTLHARVDLHHPTGHEHLGVVAELPGPRAQGQPTIKP